MAEQSGYYEINDRQYPRVTRVLNVISKPGLDRWRGRLGNEEADRISRDGADFGTEFHKIAADVNRGSHLRRGWYPPNQFKAQAMAYIEWINKYVSEIHYTEKLVVSEKHIYAGTLDLLATLRGDTLPSIIDVKTSNSIVSDWPLQLSAYRYALEEEGTPTLRRLIVRIPKKGKIEAEMFQYKNHEEDEDMWFHTLASWRWLQTEQERNTNAKVQGGIL